MNSARQLNAARHGGLGGLRRQILDHDFATQARARTTSATTTSPAARGDDLIFGQLGNDTIQGDGSIDLAGRRGAHAADGA